VMSNVSRSGFAGCDSPRRGRRARRVHRAPRSGEVLTPTWPRIHAARGAARCRPWRRSHGVPRGSWTRNHRGSGRRGPTRCGSCRSRDRHCATSRTGRPAEYSGPSPQCRVHQRSATSGYRNDCRRWHSGCTTNCRAIRGFHAWPCVPPDVEHVAESTCATFQGVVPLRPHGVPREKKRRWPARASLTADDQW
jgi:hypothetical protein